MTTDNSPPQGYTKPSVVWCVEFIDPREPHEGHRQVGAFTTEGAATELQRRLMSEGFFADLRVN